MSAKHDAFGLRSSKAASAHSAHCLNDGTTQTVELNGSGAVTAVNTFGATGLISRGDNLTGTHYTFDTSGNVANYVTTPTSATCVGFDAYGRQYGGSFSEPFGYGAQ